MTIIDYYFSEGCAGSFESHIFKAWHEASASNRRRLEDTFPEFFPLARMYGAGDFRMFPNREKLDEALKPLVVKMNQWGKVVEAVKLLWSEIKQRETHDYCENITRHFRVSDRAFTHYYPDPTNYERQENCLCFDSRQYSYNHLWFITTEDLETLTD